MKDGLPEEGQSTPEVITLNDIDTVLTTEPWDYNKNELPLIGKFLDRTSPSGFSEYIAIKNIDVPTDEFIVKMNYDYLGRTRQGLVLPYKWDEILNSFKLGEVLSFGCCNSNIIDDGIIYNLDYSRGRFQIIVPRFPTKEQMFKCLSSTGPSFLSDNFDRNI